MEKKKSRASEEKAEILSQCPECLSLETFYGGNSYNVKTRPSVVLLKGTAEKLCARCVSRLTIE